MKYCKRIDCTVEIFHTDHCNRPECDAPIVWKNYVTYTGKEPMIHPDTGNKRPLIAPNGSDLHKCMYKGQKWYFEKKKKGERVTDFFNNNNNNNNKKEED